MDGRRYPWGEEFLEQRCNTKESGSEGTTEAGKYAGVGLSPYGAEDMAGNVWEWTESHWAEGNENRVLRGGSWYNSRDGASCSYRNGGHPDIRSSYIGF